MSMSVSAVFGCRMMMPTHSTAAPSLISAAIPRVGINCSGLVIECSSRPKKKATAHHMKTRPRKRQPWDIKRKPTVYPPLPPLPPEWTLVSSAEAEPPVAAVPPTPPPSS